MGTVTIFSGGYSHPFEETGNALKDLVTGMGHTVALTDDFDTAIAKLADGDLFIVNALLWSMTQHKKYAADRPANAYLLPDAHTDALEQFVHNGGSLFAMHTSVICFDTQPRWKDLLGGGWTWGISHHPPYGPITVTPTGNLGLDPIPFDIEDEAYHALAPHDDALVLATSDTGDGPQPVSWVRKVGEGRVAVNALGHDARSLNTPGHLALNKALLSWLI